MKGDKGTNQVIRGGKPSTDLDAEFSGTLVGFDDYVSECGALPAGWGTFANHVQTWSWRT